MYFLSENISNFLEREDWVLVDESRQYLYWSPPADMNFDGKYLIKLPKNNLSEDYKLIINGIIKKLEIIYSEKFFRTFSAFKGRNEVSDRKYLAKKDWIMSEEKSKIDKLGIYDIYVPDRY